LIINNIPFINAVLFDFGGVLAEEGFKAGLTVIAEKNGLEPKKMLRTAFEAIYESGFVSGKVQEDVFWNIIRDKTGISGANSEFSEEIVSHFILRRWMLNVVGDLKNKGIVVAILSDQTKWLDDLNKRYNFFQLFDYVFNSFYLGMTKKDPAVFSHVLKRMDFQAENVLFIDDYLPHIKRAQDRGFQTIFYTGRENFLQKLQDFFLNNPVLIKN